MAERNEEEGENQEKWTGNRKFSAVILVLCGIAVLGIGLWQFAYRVRAPFFGRATGLKNFKSLDQQEFERLVAKRNKDTDGDGLTDFDEEYVYSTSPYLADSDSDGFSDKEEIDSGNDPNCPSGKTCGLAEVPASSGEAAAGELLVNSGILGQAGGTGTESMQTLLAGQATAAEVRAALRQSGVSEDVLGKIDDKTLMEVYAESLKETAASGTGQNLNVNAVPEIPSVNLNFNTNSSAGADSTVVGFTPAEVRQILRDAGIDEATLRGIDDVTLMKVFKEAIKPKQ